MAQVSEKPTGLALIVSMDSAAPSYAANPPPAADNIPATVDDFDLVFSAAEDSGVEMQLHLLCRRLDGVTYTLDLPGKATLKDAKDLLRERYGLQPANVALVKGAICLDQANQVLAEAVCYLYGNLCVYIFYIYIYISTSRSSPN